MLVTKHALTYFYAKMFFDSVNIIIKYKFWFTLLYRILRLTIPFLRVRVHNVIK